MVEYYISSTKYSLQERMPHRGKVYGVVFRIVTPDGTEKQKKLSGYANKTLAKQGYTDFATSKYETKTYGHLYETDKRNHMKNCNKFSNTIQ